MSTITHPLNQLLKKGTRWVWSKACNKAFLLLKEKLASAEVLAHYDVNLPIKLDRLMHLHMALGQFCHTRIQMDQNVLLHMHPELLVPLRELRSVGKGRIGLSLWGEEIP